MILKLTFKLFHTTERGSGELAQAAAAAGDPAQEPRRGQEEGAALSLRSATGPGGWLCIVLQFILL